MKSNLIDLEVQRHHETPTAIKVSLDGENKNAVWVPSQFVEINDGTPNGIINITLPRWLARDKGLI